MRLLLLILMLRGAIVHADLFSSLGKWVEGDREGKAITAALKGLGAQTGLENRLYVFECNGALAKDIVYQSPEKSVMLGNPATIRIKAENIGAGEQKLKIFRCNKSLGKGDYLPAEFLDDSCSEQLYQIEGKPVTGKVDTELGSVGVAVPQFLMTWVKSCTPLPDKTTRCEPSRFTKKEGNRVTEVYDDLILLDPRVGGLAWCCSSKRCADEAAKIAVPRKTAAPVMPAAQSMGN